MWYYPTFEGNFEKYFKNEWCTNRTMLCCTHKVYMPNELAEKYPNLTMGENIWGLLDPTAGILFSDKALGAVWVNSLLLR